MKKIKIQNIISYIINFILIGVILLSNKGFILNNDKIILKEMSESTQVSDLNKSINELEASHEEYQNYIQTKKTDLATAITNAGVTTSGNDTFEIMINNVNKLETLKILEEGTIDTGTVNNSSGKYLTINFENTYEKEDNAILYFKSSELLSGKFACYIGISSTPRIIEGNTYTFYVWNGAGTNPGSARISYLVLKTL